MSYISTQLSHDFSEVMVWERTKEGRVLNRYPAPYYFYIKSESGDYNDLYGHSLTRLDFNSHGEFKRAQERYRLMGEQLYESDISSESKVLSKYYYNKESETPDHIAFFDIEVDYDREQGMADPENPYAPISAISLFHFWTKKTFMLLISPHHSPWSPGPKWTKSMLSSEVTALADIRFYESEKELLLDFFHLIEDVDFISGWNITGYDTGYIYERCQRLFGKAGEAMLGFPGARTPYWKEINGKYGSVDKTPEVFGRMWMDYMKLFEKFEMELRPSYSLEAISDEILPELPKLEYEGSLYTLYRDDFEHFVKYGIRDSECLDGFENKLGYVRLAIQLARGSTTAMKNVLGTLKVVEDAIINFCHHERNLIIPDKDYAAEAPSEKFTGATVLKPRMGMHENVVAIDINSLYPSTLRTLNASPETIVGQFYENHVAFSSIRSGSSTELFFKNEQGEVASKTALEWKQWILDEGYTISAAGTIFDQNKPGIIPIILGNWYSMRQEYQAKKKEAYTKMDEARADGNHDDFEEQQLIFGYYDRLQYVYKILLNSAYGALGNKFFKWFDLRLAESTTRSSREILFHMIAKISELLTGTYSPPEVRMVDGEEEFHPTSECTVYGDTDSCYALSYATSIEEAKQVGHLLEVGVNKSFAAFCKETFNSDNNVIRGGLDLVSSKSIFLKPKYYIMHLDHCDGHDCDTMKVMGLQIKTTKIPKVVGNTLTKFIERLLKDETWRTIQEEIVNYKEKITTDTDALIIGLPTGIKKFEQYYSRWLDNDPTLTRIPGHVSAAILYNECLKQYNDLESPRIASGARLKRYILTKAVGEFKSIALPTDLKAFPEWFTMHFEPLIDRDAHGLRLVDKPLEGILTAIGERVPSRQSMMYEDLTEY